MWSDGTGDTSGFSHVVRLPKDIEPLERPFDEPLEHMAQRLYAAVPELEECRVTGGDMPTFHLPGEHLVAACKALRDDPDLRFEMCTSVSGVHFPDAKELHAVYHLLSLSYRRRLRLEVACTEDNPHIPSVVSVYPMVNYHERETWDMFGIVFDGHPSLTRILMPDDWQGHPQRKDYQLGGIPVEFNGAEVRPVEERRTYR